MISMSEIFYLADEDGLLGGRRGTLRKIGEELRPYWRTNALDDEIVEAIFGKYNIVRITDAENDFIWQVIRE